MALDKNVQAKFLFVGDGKRPVRAGDVPVQLSQKTLSTAAGFLSLAESVLTRRSQLPRRPRKI